MSGYPMIDALNAASLREKVARIVDPKAFDHPTVHPQHFVARRRVSLSKADAILTALASGSGDHAELARLADDLRKFEHHAVGSLKIDMGEVRKVITACDAHTAIIAENAALRAAVDRVADGSMRQTYKLLAMHTRATEAERKLAEAVEALEEIAAIEPKPFEGGLDMEAIRACEECRRYEGHPVQHGICNTHLRPIWDREKHEGHEEKALGYRAKSIARTFLSKEADQ